MQTQDHIFLQLFQKVNCKKAVSKVWYKESCLFSLDGIKDPDAEQIPGPSSNVYESNERTLVYYDMGHNVRKCPFGHKNDIFSFWYNLKEESFLEIILFTSSKYSNF